MFLLEEDDFTVGTGGVFREKSFNENTVLAWVVC